MSRPGFQRKIRLDVVHGHGGQLVSSIFEHAASRLIHVQNLGIRADPEKSLDGLVDGELSQFEGFLHVSQHRNVFVEHDRAEDDACFVPNRNGRIANGLLRPIEAFEIERFVQ